MHWHLRGRRGEAFGDQGARDVKDVIESDVMLLAGGGVSPRLRRGAARVSRLLGFE